MRYVIIGAGAIGGVVAARLAQHSTTNPPLLIARGDHGDAIEAAGLRVRSPDDDTVIRLPLASSAAGVHLQIDDVLVFATKTQQVEQALREWADQPVHDGRTFVGSAGAILPAFTALNGIESERIALRHFARVFAVCVWLPGVHLTPGEVVVRIAPSSGTFVVGRYAAEATEADRELLATLEADWTGSTFQIFLADDVMRWKHRKLLSNLGNALQALLGPAVEGTDDLRARLEAEAVEIYTAAGITWPTADDEEAWRGDSFDVRPVPGLEGDFGGSSWQSIQRGTGSIETDYLNGEIALMARLHGLEAPLNAEVQRLARQAAGSGAGAASMTVDQVSAALDEVDHASVSAD
ncbi:2-dehydropantoate 2-reductase [Frondihabitans sucicola]|uniref:2-dehydropantoate 2-reductase n=1 Tax=Frondihabitans sucicola TaxID=1268041 RepID=A0ABM8GIW6_9MICO|nr:2-dehydropantoate 2-reductase N-terminal domain-containing protein [Frondihabitans sucicola]BDZ48333.1 2-dehydropantoate 2-reductase [Frondihabitans sucicola]